MAQKKSENSMLVLLVLPIHITVNNDDDTLTYYHHIISVIIIWSKVYNVLMFIIYIDNIT